MRAAIFLLAALAAVATGTPVEKKKVEPFWTGPYGPNQGKIVGGEPATPHEFPWIVDMRQGFHYCAGSIISPEWVVTAAHCSQNGPSSYTLTAGDHNIGQQEGNEQVRQVVQIINHPQYGSPLQFENDIALMKVEPPFDFNEFVQPVEIPALNTQPTQMATVLGWGALTEGGSSPTILHKVSVPYVDDNACNVAYDGDIASSMICYGEGGKDSCQGDSGGPIMFTQPDSANVTLAGIVSWGYGCARPGYPGVYTEASYYGEWIRTATTPTEEDPEPIEHVMTCGGFIEASSGTIHLTTEQTTAGTTCMWVLKTPYDSLRMRLTESGLGNDDHIFVTRYDGASGAPGTQTQVSDENVDYRMSGGMMIITLTVNNAAQGFSLDFFSSGFGDGTPALSGYASLNTTTGSYSYPENGGEYRNGENALFLVNSGHGGDTSLTFTALDVESSSTCSYDAVAVYAWVNHAFVLRSRFCGTTLPNAFHLPGGVGLVTFITDSSITGSGFTFNWV